MLAGAEERPRLLNPHSFFHSFLSPRFFAVTFLGRVLPWRVRGVFFRVHRLAGVGRGSHLHLEQIVGFVGLCAGLGGNGIGAVAMRSIGAKIAAAELIMSGTTAFADMYYFEAEVARATSEAGIRGLCGETILKFPAPDAESYEDSLAYTEKFIQEWKDHPLVIPAVAPHAPYTLVAQMLFRLRCPLFRLRCPCFLRSVVCLQHWFQTELQLHFHQSHRL